MYKTTADIKKRLGYSEYLPDNLRRALEMLDGFHKERISEVRIKNGGYVSVYSDKLYFLSENGRLLQNTKGALSILSDAFYETVDKMTKRSLYAVQNELRHGFLILEGGHRVGVCGRTLIENGRVCQLGEVSSLNVRISREIKGCADEIVDKITGKNTILISPPACGKTTILRDLARLMSERMMKVGISDERGEIASAYKGIPQLDVGANTDVYTNCPKSDGMIMLLRSMSPDVIITDEVGTNDDEEAIFQVINAGVKVVCSAHGYGVEDLERRGLLAELLKKNIFERVVILSRRNGPGTIERID